MTRPMTPSMTGPRCSSRSSGWSPARSVARSAARPILALSPIVSTTVCSSWHHPHRGQGTLGPMGLFDRFRRGTTTRTRAPAKDAARTGSTRVRASDAADEQHLREFVATRRGVEGFVEPRTAVSDVTLLLVAHDGEWTRRRVPSVDWAHKFCNTLPGARPTTPPSSASRSGCATTTAGRSSTGQSSALRPCVECAVGPSAYGWRQRPRVVDEGGHREAGAARRRRDRTARRS